MKFVDWSSSIEVEMLKKSHVGIMPLDNDAFSQGKSAFKLIQYLGAGLPMIASPVGENNKICENNSNGYLARTEDEWIKALTSLKTDQVLRERFAESSGEKAFEYSLQRYGQTVVGFCNDFLERDENYRRKNENQ